MALVGAAVLLVMAVAARASTVVLPSSLAGTSLSTPTFEFSKDVDFAALTNVSLASFDEAWCDDGCKGPPVGFSVAANTALLQDAYSTGCFVCGFERMAIFAQDAGAVAVLWFSHGVAGHEATVVLDFDFFDEAKARGAPALELVEEEAEMLGALVAAGETVTLDLAATYNAWTELFDSGVWVFMRAFIGGTGVMLSAYGGWRLFVFSRLYHRKGHGKVAVAVLALELCSNLFRIAFAVDPMWSLLIYSYGTGRFLLTITTPFGLLSTVVLFLSWSDTLKSYSVKTTVFRTTRTRAIFTAVATFLIGMEVLVTMLAAFKGLVFLPVITAPVSSLCALIIAFGIYRVGSRLLILLQATTATGSLNENGPHSAGSPTQTDVVSSASGNSEWGSNLAEAAGFDTEASVSEFGSPKTGFGGSPGIAGKSSASSKVLKTARSFLKKKSDRSSKVRALTKKIRSIAVLLALDAIVIALAGQLFVVFNPAARTTIVILWYTILGIKSYITIGFFEVYT